MNKLILSIILLSVNLAAFDDTYYYVSTGLSFGINSSKEFFIDGKLSINRVASGHYKPYNVVSLTTGFNSILGNKSKKTAYNEYNYLLAQFGANTFAEDAFSNSLYFLSGIGIGTIFTKGNINTLSPMIRLYSGAFLFPEIDIIAYELKNVSYNYGLRGAIPLWVKLDRPLFGD